MKFHRDQCVGWVTVCMSCVNEKNGRKKKSKLQAWYRKHVTCGGAVLVFKAEEDPPLNKKTKFPESLVSAITVLCVYLPHYGFHSAMHSQTNVSEVLNVMLPFSSKRLPRVFRAHGEDRNCCLFYSDRSSRVTLPVLLRDRRTYLAKCLKQDVKARSVNDKEF